MHVVSLPTDENQCLDYLHVTRTVFNDDYCTCGRVGVGGQTFANLSIPQDGAEFERISMTHRSNSDCRGFGTLVTVTCTNQTEARKRRATCRDTFVVPKLRSTHPPVPSLVSRVLIFMQTAIIIFTTANSES